METCSQYNQYNREEGWRRICDILASQGDVSDIYRVDVCLTRKLVRIPRDPWLRLARGIVRADAGRFNDAFEDFALVERNARSAWIREFARELMNDLERWQLCVLKTLLSEDRVFRAAFRADPRETLRKRGFCLTQMGHELLMALEMSALRNPAPPPGIS